MRFAVGLRVVLGFLLVGVGIPAARPAHAQWTYVQWSGGASSDRLIPLEDVFAMLQKRYTGEDLGAAKRQGHDGAPLYEIKWLTQDGRKLVFTVDARSGSVLSTRGAN